MVMDGPSGFYRKNLEDFSYACIFCIWVNSKRPIWQIPDPLKGGNTDCTKKASQCINIRWTLFGMESYFLEPVNQRPRFRKIMLISAYRYVSIVKHTFVPITSKANWKCGLNGKIVSTAILNTYIISIFVKNKKKGGGRSKFRRLCVPLKDFSWNYDAVYKDK